MAFHLPGWLHDISGPVNQSANLLGLAYVEHMYWGFIVKAVARLAHHCSAVASAILRDPHRQFGVCRQFDDLYRKLC